MGYCSVVVDVWDSYVGYCGEVVGVWDSYVGFLWCSGWCLGLLGRVTVV